MKAKSGTITSIAVLACLIAALLLPAAALAEDTTGRTTGYQSIAVPLELSQTEQMLLDLVNNQRAKRGLAKLRFNATLTTAARAHSRDMGDRQYFSHDSLGGESFATRLIRFGYSRSGYTSWRVGENIAYGSGLYGTAVYTVNAWMSSPAHKAVILTRTFRDAGIGAVACESGYGAGGGPVTFFTLDVGRRVR